MYEKKRMERRGGKKREGQPEEKKEKMRKKIRGRKEVKQEREKIWKGGRKAKKRKKMIEKIYKKSQWCNVTQWVPNASCVLNLKKEEAGKQPCRDL